jgi:tetratricopeptide (TPR) repeat protein
LEVCQHVRQEHLLDLFLSGRLPEGFALGGGVAIRHHDHGGQLLIAAAKRLLGTVELRLGNFDRSESLLMDVLKTSEEFPKDDYGIYSTGFAQYGLGDLEYELGNMKKAREWYQKALATWQDPTRKDPVRHISYALNGLGFVELKERNHEDARRFFKEGIQSAEEFGRVDELAKGQLGLASVHLETDTDLDDRPDTCERIDREFPTPGHAARTSTKPGTP